MVAVSSNFYLLSTNIFLHNKTRPTYAEDHISKEDLISPNNEIIPFFCRRVGLSSKIHAKLDWDCKYTNK